MRDLIIKDMLSRLPDRYDSMRWEVVAKRMCEMQGGDPSSKAFRKGLSTYHILETDFDRFSDREVLAFFELVVRRVYVCM